MEQFFPIPTYWTELFCPILPYLTKPYILIIMATPITNLILCPLKKVLPNKELLDGTVPTNMNGGKNITLV